STSPAAMLCCSKSAVAPVWSIDAAVQPTAEVSGPAKQVRLWTRPGPVTFTIACSTGTDQGPTAYQRSSSPSGIGVTAPLTSYSRVAVPLEPEMVIVSPERVPSPLKSEIGKT